MLSTVKTLKNDEFFRVFAIFFGKNRGFLLWNREIYRCRFTADEQEVKMTEKNTENV